MEVANQAINNSGHLWPTSVEGGPTVNIAGFDGNPIPAVYAQAYLAKTGHHYVLITNKSAAAQTAIIDLNGAQVQATFTVTYVANSSALAANSAIAPTNVQIQTTTSGNPVSLAPYSVTTVYW
jgi:alpha-L-arabinofuranosidase